METIKIAHLYYDLMNLYGEHGNVLALRHHLENHKVRVITHYLSVEDNIDFSKYDIFYIGSGNKENFLFVLDNMLKHKSEFIKAYKENKFFIVTGNALDFFGKAYYTNDNIKKETSFTTVQLLLKRPARFFFFFIYLWEFLPKFFLFSPQKNEPGFRNPSSLFTLPS